ncbi:MAG: L-threonylcarbamoyladenylate synthase [Flavobacteriales bacterium]
MLVQIHPDNPESRKLAEVVKVLQKGGVIIYPTDTVYSIGCSLEHKRAIEKVAQIKGLKLKKANFSIIFNDLSSLSEYTKQVDRSTYKILNRALPGPYTFILEANNNIPKLFDTNKKTIGIRIPDNNVTREIVKLLGCPLVATSVHDEDEIIAYTTDPEVIHQKLGNQVDLVIDSGFSKNIASTVIDCSNGDVEIIREGAGPIEGLF